MKKNYQKPEMKVFLMKSRQHLLTASEMDMKKDKWNNEWENE